MRCIITITDPSTVIFGSMQVEVLDMLELGERRGGMAEQFFSCVTIGGLGINPLTSMKS